MPRNAIMVCTLSVVLTLSFLQHYCGARHTNDYRCMLCALR